MTDKTSASKEFTVLIRERYPNARKAFNDWFIERVVMDDYPSAMVVNGKSRAFNDWPFKLQCMYFAEFLTTYGMELTLSRIEETRFKAVLLVGFQEAERHLKKIGGTEE